MFVLTHINITLGAISLEGGTYLHFIVFLNPFPLCLTALGRGKLVCGKTVAGRPAYPQEQTYDAQQPQRGLCPTGLLDANIVMGEFILNLTYKGSL